MSKVMQITSALAAAMLGAAPGALAQVTTSTDTTYIRQAIHGNATEVALGRLAESRADNSDVEEFAERMISDHNSMNEQWAELAQENDMRVLGVEFGEAGEQAIERLEDLDGAEFDQAYMTEMIRNHEQDLAAFQRMATSARSPAVRQLASSGVSTIQQHLTLARQVGSRVGVSTVAGRTGGVGVPAPAPTDDDRRRTTTPNRTIPDELDDRDDGDEGARLRASDRAFINNVLQDHLMHIRLAERARREARSEDVRRLAERMEKDFEFWWERWEYVAKRYDVNVPKNLGRLHGQKVERLERASERNIDRVYATIVADHLASVVPYFQKEGQAVRPKAARWLVDQELPVIREQLARAQRLQGKASTREEDSDRE